MVSRSGRQLLTEILALGFRPPHVPERQYGTGLDSSQIIGVPYFSRESAEESLESSPNDPDMGPFFLVRRAPYREVTDWVRVSDTKVDQN